MIPHNKLSMRTHTPVTRRGRVSQLNVAIPQLDSIRYSGLGHGGPCHSISGRKYSPASNYYLGQKGRSSMESHRVAPPTEMSVTGNSRHAHVHLVGIVRPDRWVPLQRSGMKRGYDPPVLKYRALQSKLISFFPLFLGSH